MTKTKQGSALSQRKVLRPAKEGTITRAMAKAAGKAVSKNREQQNAVKITKVSDDTTLEVRVTLLKESLKATLEAIDNLLERLNT